VKVSRPGVDQAGALLGLGDQIVGAAGGGEFADGGRVQAQFPPDHRPGQALGRQVLDCGVVLAHPGDDLLLRRGLPHRRQGLAGRSGGRFAEVSTVALTVFSTA
jgi:hypothetical protein